MARKPERRDTFHRDVSALNRIAEAVKRWRPESEWRREVLACLDRASVLLLKGSPTVETSDRAEEKAP